MTDRERLLPLVGAYNFRDLGGYPTVGGGRTRWGRLFRSDTLHELTDDDLVVLRSVGLATVVDLRTATEVERVGRGPLAGEPVRYVHLSVLQDEGGEGRAAPVQVDDDIADRYLSYLATGRALVDAVALMADDTAFPLVFHCAAGKDRTGVLAALVLSCLGVERQVIVDDYVLTAARMDLILSRLRRDPLYGDRVDDLPPQVLTVEAATMERFLARLDDRHGGARQWALEAGLAPADLDRLTAHLVEPGP